MTLAITNDYLRTALFIKAAKKNSWPLPPEQKMFNCYYESIVMIRTNSIRKAFTLLITNQKCTTLKLLNTAASVL